jgi:hypothetical protein
MTDVTRKATLTQEHDNERVSAWTRRYASPRAPVAQWIEQRFPKPRAQVRFLSGALSNDLQETASLQEFFLSF